MIQLSASDKLHALHHAYPEADNDLGDVYRAACEQWFAQLTQVSGGSC